MSNSQLTQHMGSLEDFKAGFDRRFEVEFSVSTILSDFEKFEVKWGKHLSAFFIRGESTWNHKDLLAPEKKATMSPLTIGIGVLEKVPAYISSQAKNRLDMDECTNESVKTRAILSERD